MRLSQFTCGLCLTALLSACGGGDSPNVAPVTNAGASQTVSALSVVTLDGSGSFDANGDPLTYQWTLSTKPSGSAAKLSAATSAKPTFTADAVGNYVATLVVNDGKLSSQAATITVAAKPSVESNIATVLKVIANNDAKDFDANLPLLAPEFTGNSFSFAPTQKIIGRQAMIDKFRETETAFPTAIHTIYHTFGNGDFVEIHFSFKGPFLADLTNPPIKANKNVIDFHYNMLVRMNSAGQLVEVTWFPFDSFLLMLQLGLLG